MNKRNEYPRPYLRRDDWLDLNGEWQFAFGEELDRKEAFANKKYPRTINVPFSYQYPDSGICDKARHDEMWYRRAFKVEKKDLARKAILCFNAVDYECEVYLNGVFVARHAGGFTPFNADVSGIVGLENELIVHCKDAPEVAVPRGKQSWRGEPFGCWYVPNSGIWQSVWLEFADGDDLVSYTIVTDIDRNEFRGELTTRAGKADRCKMTLTFKGENAGEYEFSLDGRHSEYSVKLRDRDFLNESDWWTPENPVLYYLDIELFEGDKRVDLLHTRFGMKKISAVGDRLYLNNKPYYQRLILDQGYFKDGGLTPPSAEALREDIRLSKAMGYNGARKHQKFEDPYFYYYAEEEGFLVWCEMPSAYGFDLEEQYNLLDEWQNIVRVACNFTSVVCYVPLNESWGVRKIYNDRAQQDFSRAMYYVTRAADPYKLVSTNDGWENVNETDITGIHDYSFDSSQFKAKYFKENMNDVVPNGRKTIAENAKYLGQPVVFSEFGGIAMKKDAENGNWGYNSSAADDEEFYRRYADLMKGVSEMWFSGFCYTQLTDVQQEVNGLLDEDHKPKFDVERIKKLTQLR